MSDDRPTSLAFRLTLFLASLAFFVLAAIHASTVQAATVRWIILPGINLTGIYNYGWHFDEAGYPWFAARDYNHDTDNNSITAYLRTKASAQLPWPVRYNRFVGTGGCRVFADAQFLDPVYGWLTLPGTRLHYLHLKTQVTGGTGWMQAPNSTITAAVGKIANTGTQCADWGYAHLHQSADVSSASYMVGAGYNGDTCWASDDFYCSPGPAWYWGDHEYCPYGWDEEWVVRTGTPTEYVCAEWQLAGSNKDSAAFVVVW